MRQPVYVILIVADALAQNGHQVISNHHAVTIMPIEHIRHCISHYTKYEFDSPFVLRIYRYSQIENIQENNTTWFIFLILRMMEEINRNIKTKCLI